MGCDIHLHIEVKLNGKWEHYAMLRPARNYRLFARMANVRNSGGEIEPISSARGLPDDATTLTKFCSDRDGSDGYSHSWLDAKELADLEDWYPKNPYPHEEPDAFWMERWTTFCFGNSWKGFTSFPTDNPKGVTDVRWVFWFDN